MSRSRVLTLLVGIALYACGPASPSSSAGGEPIELAVGESAVLEDGELILAFREVHSDSRCPVDVNCIVAGEAAVVLRVIGDDGREEELTFDVPPGGTAEGDFGSYHITILELEPQTRSDREIEPDEYTIRVQVSSS